MADKEKKKKNTAFEKSCYDARYKTVDYNFSLLLRAYKPIVSKFPLERMKSYELESFPSQC